MPHELLELAFEDFIFDGECIKAGLKLEAELAERARQKAQR
jgi:hypothetical protein